MDTERKETEQDMYEQNRQVQAQLRALAEERDALQRQARLCDPQRVGAKRSEVASARHTRLTVALDPQTGS